MVKKNKVERDNLSDKLIRTSGSDADSVNHTTIDTSYDLLQSKISQLKKLSIDLVSKEVEISAASGDMAAAAFRAKNLMNIFKNDVPTDPTELENFIKSLSKRVDNQITALLKNISESLLTKDFSNAAATSPQLVLGVWI